MIIGFELFLAYTLACVLVILSPGPDNILAISRGLSQGPLAATVSSAGAGLGLMLHVGVASLGLAVLIQSSVTAFTVVKVMGAAYLIWLGIAALKNRDLISFSPTKRKTMGSILLTGFLTNALNPKPVVFIMAFIPQFIDAAHGSVAHQTLLFGAWFAVLAFLIFATAGIFASTLVQVVRERPQVVAGLNVGAGAALIAAGVSIAFLERR